LAPLEIKFKREVLYHQLQWSAAFGTIAQESTWTHYRFIICGMGLVALYGDSTLMVCTVWKKAAVRSSQTGMIFWPLIVPLTALWI